MHRPFFYAKLFELSATQEFSPVLKKNLYLVRRDKLYDHTEAECRMIDNLILLKHPL